MPKFSPREAVCTYQSWDFAEAADYRYQSTRNSLPIYSTADGYVCAMANGKKPPKKDSNGFPNLWLQATGSQAEYCKSRGYTVWIQINIEEY